MRIQDVRACALGLGFALGFIVVLAIFVAALHGGPTWNVTISFNSLGEGPLEIILFPAGLAMIAFAIYREFAKKSVRTGEGD